MSKVQIADLQVCGDTQKFSDNYKFEVHFECIEAVKEAIEFKVVYVGKADDDQYDQALDKVELDDVPVGLFKFTIECPPPDSGRIPPDDLLGVTVILICGSYKGKEFVRIGYYVHVTYDDQALIEDPPLFPAYDKLTRQLMVDAPRVTHFSIPWDNETPEELPVTSGEEDPIRQYMKDASTYMREMEVKLQNGSAPIDVPPSNGTDNNSNGKTDDDQFMLF